MFVCRSRAVTRGVSHLVLRKDQREGSEKFWCARSSIKKDDTQGITVIVRVLQITPCLVFVRAVPNSCDRLRVAGKGHRDDRRM